MQELIDTLTRQRSLLRGGLVVATIFVVGVVLWLLLLMIRSTQSRTLYGPDSISTAYSASPSQSDSAPDITLHFELLSATVEDYEAYVGVPYVIETVGFKSASDSDPNCIEEILFQSGYRYDAASRMSFSDDASWEFEGLCASDRYGVAYSNDGLERRERESYRKLAFTVSSVNRSNMFPFDGGELAYRISVRMVHSDTNASVEAITLAPDVVVTMNAPLWEPYLTFDRQIFDNSGSARIVEIHLQRPSIYIINTISVFGLVFILILASVFVPSSGTFLELTIVVLFGLWGLRPSLVPSFMTGFTFVDVLTWAMYLFLSLSAFARFLVRPLWRRTKSDFAKSMITDLTVAEARELIKQASDLVQLDTWFQEEQKNKQRKTILAALTKRKQNLF